MIPCCFCLVKIRRQLMADDYRALYEVWLKYGYPEVDEEEDWSKPPVPEEKETGGKIIAEFAGILDYI